MTESLLASYEALPYESTPITATHLDNIAMVARLHGANPAPPTQCRVLELGCASGGNLLPMALAFPQSQFVGIDLAPGQIVAGQAAAQAVGAANLRLDTLSITDIDDAFGTFDYIICHGVYSWVPPEVQAAVLRVCARNLTPAGVAYVSYNTYPGWHRRQILREMLMQQDEPARPPAERIARARAFADRVAADVQSSRPLYAALLREEVEVLRTETPSHLLHEQLEPFNEPLWFSEFARRAAAHGLRFLAEAQLVEDDGLGGDDAPGGDEYRDVVAAEQYRDFVRGRTFRRTLLCRADMPVSRVPRLDVIRQLFISARAEAVAPAPDDLARDPGARAFRSVDDVTVTTNNPIVVGALEALLDVQPARLSFYRLLELVGSRSSAPHEGVMGGAAPAPPADLANTLAAVLLQCARTGVIALHSMPAAFATQLGTHPVASPLARWQHDHFRTVATLRHQHTQLSGIERIVLAQLDGAHDRTRLVDAVERAIADGRLDTGDERPDRARLETLLDQILHRFLVIGLLIER